MSPSAPEIEDRVRDVLDRIAREAGRAGRSPDSVRLVAVSKTVEPGRICRAAVAGAGLFGENYIQEARDKIAELSDLAVSWHFTGHLQTNKVRYAVRLFDLIHTVASLRLAVEIDHRARLENKVQDILVQVNVSGEEAKDGIAPEEAEALVRKIADLAHVRLRGLMTMPPYNHAPKDSRPHFAALAALARSLDGLSIPGVQMNELSMGMSHDFPVAIQEGATLVRVGTALFGERS
ncbi:MAG: YggS family pyridoxal phosphate-dependent enzyme [Proteobacteria bacterium]|nr:YggS family pyridoxal phosphate-dependent enzyme [Pseudomonadota bacterium]